jgi:hypothetical protein
MIAETLITGTGLALCAGMRPPGWAGWALGLWMFFLVQALYFALVDPVQAPRGDCPGREVNETAHRRAQALLREEKLERAFAELQLSARRGSDTC